MYRDLIGGLVILAWGVSAVMSMVYSFYLEQRLAWDVRWMIIGIGAFGSFLGFAILQQQVKSVMRFYRELGPREWSPRKFWLLKDYLRSGK